MSDQPASPNRRTRIVIEDADMLGGKAYVRLDEGALVIAYHPGDGDRQRLTLDMDTFEKIARAADELRMESYS